MYEFFDRLISLVIPRIRDFRGLSPRSFDGRGNYSLGLSEQIVFPEISIDDVEFVQGLNITVTVKNSTDEESLALLDLFGVPFRK
jgi:large subunit ribosomal protein L5